jgi:hypothetical protein
MMQNYAAAAYELAQISPENLEHPDVLHLRCRVYWGLRNISRAVLTVGRNSRFRGLDGCSQNKVVRTKENLWASCWRRR